MDGEKGQYSYRFYFNNSFLFSGSLHIIPDDCLTEITINGKQLPKSAFFSNSCNCFNGLYLDIDNYLRKGENSIEFTIDNKQGRYGVYVKDITFYEKYFLLALIPFFLLFLRIKVLFISLLNKLTLIFQNNQGLILLLLFEFYMLLQCILSRRFLFVKGIYEYVYIVILLIIALTLTIPKIYCNFHCGKRLSIMFAFSVAIFIIYLFNIPESAFSYDYNGHMQYIQYILERRHVPVASGGWSFYHPSLYYLCASFVLQIAGYRDFFVSEAVPKISQALSLVIFIFYLYYSLKTIDLFYRQNKLISRKDSMSPKIYLLVAGVVMFWTSNAICSIRVGNDIMFDLLYAVSFYFTVKWWYMRRIEHFVLALTFAALCVWAKTNGLIAFGVIGLLLVFVGIIPQLNRRSVQYLFKLVLYIVVFSSTLYFSFYDKLEMNKVHSDNKLIVGNVGGLSESLKVYNTTENFLVLNPVKFVEIPFTSSFDDNKGRQFFWFYLLKTSMFGEFRFDGIFISWMARGLSLLLLAVIPIFVLGIFSSFREALPISVNICLLLLSMILFRIFYPYSCSNDFRYIYPTVVPFAIFIGKGIEAFDTQKWLRSFLSIILFIFVVFCGLFQIMNIVINM
ncbi:hypothetical protein [Arcticibacter tournemirensis]|nr:hypothetical protein [Arcticibacter tournemirensis]